MSLETLKHKTLSSRQVMEDGPVIPVIVVNDPDRAVKLARSLARGGIRMLEVTLRTPHALACIEAMARDVPNVVVGAGTIRCADDVHAAVRAGARFGVSPGFSARIAQACRDHALPWLPGVATSTEIMQAQEEGIDRLKFFPALQAGGIALLRAWYGPFSDVRFCPTGGIDASNAHEFLALPNVACVGGSWLVPPQAIVQGDWERIEALARAAAAIKRGV
jgi:2-dehydro-3-deoxyphosphogluconate aldolase/(4S)-4-hydroxy-2-oxoglutarate aldolase